MRRSLALGAGIVLAAQAALLALSPPSPTFFGTQVVSQKYNDALRARRTGPIDVVAVGHSHTVNGVDPAVLARESGLSVFNFGLAATDMSSQALVVRDFIVPRLAPDVLLWNMDPSIGQEGAWQSNRRMVRSDGFAVQAWPLGSWLVGPLSSALPYQKRPYPAWFEAFFDPADRRYRPDGFVPIYRLWRAGEDEELPPEWVEWAERTRRWRFPVDPIVPRPAGAADAPAPTPEETRQAQRDIEGALDLALARGIRVVAFAAPMPRERFRSDDGFTRHVRASLDDPFRLWFLDLLASRGIEFANYGYYPPISDRTELFYNVSHLNAVGAEVFSEVLARHLLASDREIPAELRDYPSALQLRAVEEAGGDGER